MKLQPIGGSIVLPVPVTLARMFEWGPGAVVRAKVRVGGAYFERPVRSLYGGRGCGVIVPKEVAVAHGVDATSEVDVPFYEWVTVEPVPYDGDDQPAKARRPGGRKAYKTKA